MRIWKRNRILKRVVLGFAVLGLVVPAGAVKAMPDAGRGYEPTKAENFVAGKTDFPSAVAKSAIADTVGLPSAGRNVYIQSRDGIELVRLQPRSTLRDSDLVEQVRVSPREVSQPQLVAEPGFDWRDAGIGASILAGLLVLGAAGLAGNRRLGRPQTA